MKRFLVKKTIDSQSSEIDGKLTIRIQLRGLLEVETGIVEVEDHENITPKEDI